MSAFFSLSLGKALGWTGWELGGDRGVSLNHSAEPTKQGHGYTGDGSHRTD